MTDTTIETIRDLRERKSLSQKTVRLAAGLTYSTYVRIEEGSGRTTPEEVAHVLEVLRGMPDGTRKLGGGRPFKDESVRAAVAAARENGRSVAAVLGQRVPAAGQPEPAAAPEIAAEASDATVEGEQPAEETKKEREARKARERRAAKKAEAEAAAAESGLL